VWLSQFTLPPPLFFPSLFPSPQIMIFLTFATWNRVKWKPYEQDGSLYMNLEPFAFPALPGLFTVSVHFPFASCFAS
jgi:hypothetical protein